MRRRQFKIAGFMGLVVLAAIGLSAFRSLPGRWPSLADCVGNGLAWAGRWAGQLSIASGLSIVAAFAIAFVMKGRARSMAAGYAAASFAYFQLAANDEKFNLFIYKHIVNLNVYVWISEHSEPSSSATFSGYLLALQSFLVVAVGLAGGLLALALTRRRDDLARPILSTTGQP